jgi:hypothetical protein
MRMKTRKILFAVLTLAVLLSVFTLNILAEEESFEFKTAIETEKTQLDVGDTFEVKVSIKDITNKDGFIGIHIKIKYDPKYLSVVYQSSEGDVSEGGSGVTFGTINLPEEWKGNPEAFQNVVIDDGKETGVIVIMCSADLTADDLLKSGFKSDTFSVTIPFKCIAASDSTSIKIDTDNELTCSQLVKVNDSMIPVDVLGQGSELEITIAQSGEQSTGGEIAKEKDNLIYILIAAGAVVVIAVVVIVIVLGKKKKK